MANCDICGANARLVKVKIDNSIMNVCSNCAQYGTRLENTKGKPFANAFSFSSKRKNKVSDTEEHIIPQYGRIIKSARESKKIKPEEFAKKMNEKESLLLKVESGHHEPSFTLAKKIERFLGVKLVEKRSVMKIHEDYDQQKHPEEKKNGELTFADILKKAMKK